MADRFYYELRTRIVELENNLKEVQEKNIELLKQTNFLFEEYQNVLKRLDNLNYKIDKTLVHLLAKLEKPITESVKVKTTKIKKSWKFWQKDKK